MSNICPVCGYPPPKPLRDYDICPCCGTQFAYQDSVDTKIVGTCFRDRAKMIIHKRLRESWIANGCPWFSRYTNPPKDWDTEKQLKNLP